MSDDGNKVRFRFYVERGQRITLRDDPPPERPKPLPRGCIPRISRLVALAHRFDGLLRDGTVATMADIARFGHVTRARVTQIMDLLLLAPDIQEDLLLLPQAEHRDPVTLRGFRYVMQTPVWAEQRKRWAEIKDARTRARSGPGASGPDRCALSACGRFALPSTRS
jgi:hypothetical protein